MGSLYRKINLILINKFLVSQRFFGYGPFSTTCKVWNLIHVPGNLLYIHCYTPSIDAFRWNGRMSITSVTYYPHLAMSHICKSIDWSPADPTKKYMISARVISYKLVIKTPFLLLRKVWHVEKSEWHIPEPFFWSSIVRNVFVMHGWTLKYVLQKATINSDCCTHDLVLNVEYNHLLFKCITWRMMYMGFKTLKIYSYLAFAYVHKYHFTHSLTWRSLCKVKYISIYEIYDTRSHSM